MQLTFDKSRCAGHAQCYANGPDLFVLDDDGYLDMPETSEVPADLEKQARSGVAACPERAIELD